MKMWSRALSVVSLMVVISGQASIACGADRVHAPQLATLHCYGLAMVGMDSVINSRLGVHPELILPLATLDPNAAIVSPEEITSEAPYSTLLLRILYEAYLWDGEPHEYASDVLDTCNA